MHIEYKFNMRVFTSIKFLLYTYDMRNEDFHFISVIYLKEIQGELWEHKVFIAQRNSHNYGIMISVNL
jgi:hypothetical protein